MILAGAGIGGSRSRSGEGEVAVRPRRLGEQRDDDAQQPGEREDQRQTSLGPGTEPVTDRVGAPPVGHRRHDPVVRLDEALGDRETELTLIAWPFVRGYGRRAVPSALRRNYARA